MRVLLCGGGTAGHVNPALAIAETIERNNPGSVFAYVVNKNGIENRLVPYKKYVINVRGLKKSVFSNIKTICLTLKAIKECKEIINNFKPDIVIGTGGYITFPVIYAAHRLHIKTVIHESNAYPGKTTRALSKYADIIFLNFIDSKNYFENKNTVVSGTPFLKGFLAQNVTKKRSSNIKTVLCFGGSLGAEKINECAIELAKKIMYSKENVRLIWGCGTREYLKCKNKLEQLDLLNEDKITLYDYINNMPQILCEADVVVCRAGAMSIAEMAYNKKCTVFIPSPNVTDNHQYKNAKVLVDNNCACLVEENNINHVTNIVFDLLNDENKRNELSENIGKFCKRDSNKIIYNEIEKLIINNKARIK